ncbi:MAG: alkaline phosphatase PafA [Ekhidna sp.]
MKKLLYCLFISLVSILTAQEKPKLVIGIVVDQMRQDYILRFSNKFSDGGFKRMIGEGFQFRNAHYNYVPTYTAPGHASIYTGTTPSNHGIIGNGWYSPETNLNVYCVSDPAQSGIGGSNSSGKMSPKNLLTSTITDELRITTNFQAKVVGVSIKDRGSVLPAGHSPNGAYWFDSKTGNFMTSTYYMDKLPNWVKKFNGKNLAAKYLENTWSTLLPIKAYAESTMDNAPYERSFRGKEETTFPYDLKELAKENGVGLVRSTPFGNTLVLDMALAAIEGEKLGADETTDMLAISFSSTDYIGHQFGSNSVEVQDTYLRLDLELERLFEYLDANFKDEYMVFLTSDHGVVNVPQFLEDNKMVGGYLEQDKFAASLNDTITSVLGAGEWVLNIGNDQVFLNRDLIQEKGLNITEVRKTIRDIIIGFDGISDAYTKEEIIERKSTDIFKKRIEHGFNAKRSGDIAVRLSPGLLSVSSTSDRKGTSHGSGYTYDTHIPIIFFGKGIKKGNSVRPVAIIDIAPTLSMLLNTSLPNASTGIPLLELFD